MILTGTVAGFAAGSVMRAVLECGAVGCEIAVMTFETGCRTSIAEIGGQVRATGQ